MSLWDYVADAETAEGGLGEGRWSSVGTVLGKLHFRLAAHPFATPTTQRSTDLHQVERARAGYDWLIAQYRSRESLGEFETWAFEAAQQRRSLLDRARSIVHDLPRLTTQVLHGDLSAPNLALRGDEVAGLIDFQPPKPRDVSWEIARIACDPRTVMSSEDWITGLIELLTSYRAENPALPTSDLTSTVAVGCAYTIFSTYPLAEPLKQTEPLSEDLMIYAHARHDAALRMLDEVERHPQRLQDALHPRWI
jgi:homoserine kinase type II